MQDMYLIPRYGDYRVVVIQKTNTNSYTLSDGSRINKEQFHKSSYKLTDEEKAVYKGELINNLVNTSNHVTRLQHQLSSIQSALNSNEFVELNKDKLQQEINEFTEYLTKLVEPFKINDKYFKFIYSYNSQMEEVK